MPKGVEDVVRVEAACTRDPLGARAERELLLDPAPLLGVEV